jgi:hypothetical protein
MRAKKSKLDPLPDTLSGLIRVALKDLRTVEASKAYKVDMDRWHTPEANGVCHVCMAGAVMATTLRCSPLAVVDTTSWLNGVEDKLQAIDCLRGGNISWAARKIYGADSRKWLSAGKFEEKHPEFSDHMPDYGTTKREHTKFHAAQRKLADALEEAGL